MGQLICLPQLQRQNHVLPATCGMPHHCARKQRPPFPAKPGGSREDPTKEKEIRQPPGPLVMAGAPTVRLISMAQSK